MGCLWKAVSLLCLVCFTLPIVEGIDSTVTAIANATATIDTSGTMVPPSLTASESTTRTISGGITRTISTLATAVNPSSVLATPTLMNTTSIAAPVLPSQQAPTTGTTSVPASNWVDKFWAKIDPLPGVIALICAACVIIILFIALCCVCHKYRKLKRLSKYKSPYVNDNTDWIRGNENVLMYERSLRASEVTPHYPMDYASVNGDRPPSYALSQFPVHDRHMR